MLLDYYLTQPAARWNIQGGHLLRKVGTKLTASPPLYTNQGTTGLVPKAKFMLDYYDYTALHYSTQTKKPLVWHQKQSLGQILVSGMAG